MKLTNHEIRAKCIFFTLIFCRGDFDLYFFDISRFANMVIRKTPVIK